MTEFDFEELDKAVNSLMDKQQNQSADTNQAVATASPATDVSPPINRPPTTDGLATTPTEARQVPEVPDRPTPPADTTISRRPAGRFMDVVHPSSDMRSNSTPERPVGRIGQTIQPVGEVANTSPNDRSEVPTQPTVSQEPIGDVKPKPPMIGGAEPINDSNQADVPGGLASDQSDVMTSPFLEDAVVEKRPLGGIEPSENIPAEPEPAVPEAMPDPIADWQPATEPVVNEVATVNPEVNQSQSPQQSTEPEAESVDETTEAPEEPLAPELSAEVLALDSNEELNPPEPEPSSPTSHGLPGDIPKQYKPVEAETPEPTAVFEEVASEPQTLQHPPKKKSGWKIVIWIVILLLLGVASGVLAWFFLIK